MQQIAYDKIPPQNLEAEESVLAAILFDSTVIRKLNLLPEYFYKASHATIFKAMLDLIKRQESVDVITLTEELRKSDKLEEIGGAAYLSALMNQAFTTVFSESHAAIIREKAELRNYLKISLDIQRTVFNLQSSDATRAVIRDALKEFNSMSKIVSASELVKSTVQQVDAIYSSSGKFIGVPTGFIDLDAHTGGWRPTDLIVIAARPGMGKTAFLGNNAIYTAELGYPVGIFEIEMGKEQMGCRHLSDIGNLAHEGVRMARLSKDEYRRFVVAAGKLAELPIYFYFEGLVTIDSIWRQSELMVDTYGVKIIFIDYLQLIASTNNKDNREKQVADISRGLKQMAKSLNVPVVVLAQLNRSCEARQDKRPMLSDLRESGAIEQDADVVMFLYRDDYYNSNSNQKGVAELIISKARHFMTGKKTLTWDSAVTKFRNMAYDQGENLWER